MQDSNVTGQKTSKQTKKEMQNAFRAQKEIGGVYVIKNTASGKMLLLSTTTISKAANQMEFAKLTGSCVHPLVAEDWSIQGSSVFELEILEQLEKKDIQTYEEFSTDIQALKELWQEKLGSENLY